MARGRPTPRPCVVRVLASTSENIAAVWQLYKLQGIDLFDDTHCSNVRKLFDTFLSVVWCRVYVPGEPRPVVVTRKFGELINGLSAM